MKSTTLSKVRLALELMIKYSIIATLVFLTLFASIAPPASAGDDSDKMAEVTFAIVYPVDPWADPDVPADPLDLLFDNLQVIVVGPQEDFADSLVFKDTSLPCGPYELSGTSWATNSYARIVQSGGPIDLWLYKAPGGQRPAYRSAILPGDVVNAAACWLKIDGGSGHWVVQEEYNLETSAAVVIVTAEVRVE